VKTFAWVGGVIIVAGLIVLAVAGTTGATAILVTGVALVAMIGLGGTLGGRHTPDAPPAAAGPVSGGEPVADAGSAEGDGAVEAADTAEAAGGTDGADGGGTATR
jgi:hypothetical protein